MHGACELWSPNGRQSHACAEFGLGGVLVAGETEVGRMLASLEVYDSVLDSWAPTRCAMDPHCALLLQRLLETTFISWVAMPMVLTVLRSMLCGGLM